MVTLKFKQKDKKNYKFVKRFQRYEFAWKYVADELMDIDETLHVGVGVQNLEVGYTRKKIWKFGSTEIKRKGIEYKICL